MTAPERSDPWELYGPVTIANGACELRRWDRGLPRGAGMWEIREAGGSWALAPFIDDDVRGGKGLPSFVSAADIEVLRSITPTEPPPLPTVEQLLARYGDGQDEAFV